MEDLNNIDTKILETSYEINKLKDWFKFQYGYKEQKYRRLIALGKADDDGISAEIKLRDLYLEAEEKRKQIQELEGDVV